MNRLSHYIFVVLLILSLPALADVEDDVLAATQAWASAYNTHVVDNVLARYHPDAVFWGTGSATIRDNPADVRVYFSGLPERPTARVEIGEYRVRVFGDFAVNTGVYIFSDMFEGALRARPARFSFVYRLVGGTWMIVDHHSSASPG